MRSFKVFLSGKVTGLPRETAIHNFNRGKELVWLNGWEAINPLDVVPEGSTEKQAMKILIPLLIDSDAILLLHDSIFSEGSQVELRVAKYCKLQIYDEDDLT
jgi:hypothetical protein